MMDQIAKYRACGLNAEYIGYTQTSAQVKRAVLNGEVQLVFFTPESIILNRTFRSMLLSRVYKENLVCVAVDEAHCVSDVLPYYNACIPEQKGIETVLPLQCLHYLYVYVRYSDTLNLRLSRIQDYLCIA